MKTLNTITLKLDTKTIELATHEINGKTLYKAQDLLTGYGYNSKKSADTVRNWLRSIEKKASRQMDVTVLQGGKVQGTYLTQRQILKLAGYVSYEFEDAVYEAFELIVNGNVEEAVAIAESVLTVEQKHMIKLVSKGKNIGKTATKIFATEDDPMNAFHKWLEVYKTISDSNYRRHVIGLFYNEIRNDEGAYITAWYNSKSISAKSKRENSGRFAEIENEVGVYRGRLLKRDITNCNNRIEELIENMAKLRETAHVIGGIAKMERLTKAEMASEMNVLMAALDEAHRELKELQVMISDSNWTPTGLTPEQQSKRDSLVGAVMLEELAEYVQTPSYKEFQSELWKLTYPTNQQL